jgi:transposase
MGQAVPVRTDYTAGEVRRIAKRAKDAAQARRLLAIAAVLDGSSRTEAAELGGMDRQTLRDWVVRFNERGPEGLVNIPSPGVPPKLDATHRAFLARIVEEGPIPAAHGVVRWRACDLIMRPHEEFGLSVSDDTIYRALKDLGFSHVSARPRAYKQDPEAMEAFKKTFPPAWWKSAPGTPVEVWFQDEMRVGQKNKLTYRWARRGSRPRAAHDQRTQSTYLFGAVCPEWSHGANELKISDQHLAPAIASPLTRAQQPREYLAIHAPELAVEPYLQILRRYRRSLLLRLEHAHRPALEDHVHRTARLGLPSVSNSEEWYK